MNRGCDISSGVAGVTAGADLVVRSRGFLTRRKEMAVGNDGRLSARRAHGRDRNAGWAGLAKRSLRRAGARPFGATPSRLRSRRPDGH